jgi:signal transduction histidine kinase/CheY-like chemotaxis protein
VVTPDRAQYESVGDPDGDAPLVQLREAQRIAGIGSWEWATGTTAVVWSEGLHLILGRHSPVSPTFDELPRYYTPSSWALLQAAIAEAVEKGTPYELELEMVRDDGSTCWTTTRGEAVRGADGAVTKLRGTVHDINARKRAEQATRDREAQLQSLAAVSQADRLSSMGLLAAGVAHEVNNPLTYVLSNLETLADEIPGIAQAALRCADALRERVGPEEFAERIGDAAAELAPAKVEGAVVRAREALEGSRRIQTLVRSLSTFSRVEKVEEGWVDVQRAIDSAVTMAQNEIKYRARLVMDLAAMPPVWASGGKLSQILLNLIINAAHAIDEGHVDENSITIRTATGADDLLIEVSDTGKGIAPEHLERIFEPFFSTKQVGRGSGLGLAICRSLVTEFGGDIRVESEVGKGTRFVVRLPVRRDVPQPLAPRVVPPRSEQSLARGRVLVVDDEPAIRKALQRMLGDAHEVVTVGSGVAGRDLLAQDDRFDVVLCDLMMPDMSGMALHEWLSEHRPALAEKVVFVTGGVFTPLAADYLARVGNLRLEKPFVVGELRVLVANLVAIAKSPA